MREDKSAESPLMERISWFILGLLLAVVTPWLVAGQPQSRIDVSKLGPQVGQRVPNFVLKDQNGNTQTLESIMGRKGAMLVFIRSADW